MSSERVEIIVYGGVLGENRRIAGGNQPASLTFERFEYKRCAALGAALVDFPVNEIHDLVR